jgi:penicillin-binding protein 2
MVPRRNPEIAIVVLQEHGDWGSLSAKIAQAMVTEYVNKKRQQDHNILDRASVSKPVEVGAIWSDPPPAGPKGHPASDQADVLHAGHFLVDPNHLNPGQSKKAVATGLAPLPAWFTASQPLRRQERLP